MSAPMFQLFKDLPPAVEAALRASIDRFGVLVHVVKDQHGNILDGHQRARIADSLGIKYPVSIVDVADEDEAREIARTLNEERRAMPKEERLVQLPELLAEGHSTRAIAGALGVSQSQVMLDKAEIEQDCSIPDRVKRKGGGTYPARREPRLPPADALAQAREVNREQGGRTVLISEQNERYTPAEYIESARAVMGGIDVDPASSDEANETIGAGTFYTIHDDGLEHGWPGRVWLNPPYGGDQTPFISRLLKQFAAGVTTQAIILVNSHATDTAWFAPLWDHLLCFTNHRINFYGSPGSGSTHGSVFIYLGPNDDGFIREFAKWGYVVERVKP